MTSSTTKTTEREQWRARILRALAELDTEPRPGRERHLDEDERVGSAATGDI